MINVENYGWILESKSLRASELVFFLTSEQIVTPAFFGAGMLSGLNASWSFCKLISSN